MKPYVICHILTSLNGKISGDFFGEDAIMPGLTRYAKLRNEYNCDAMLYGTTTMQGFGGKKYHGSHLGHNERKDYIADNILDQYLVSIDFDGTLTFDSNICKKPGRKDASYIQVVSENVSDDYLEHLRNKDISYIFAGTDLLDPALVMHKLDELFHIKRVMIAGGGYADYTFIDEIDELSLMVVPVVEASQQVTSFEAFNKSDIKNTEFKLDRCEIIEDDTIYLVYKK